jgi:hypothetical protein
MHHDPTKWWEPLRKWHRSTSQETSSSATQLWEPHTLHNKKLHNFYSSQDTVRTIQIWTREMLLDNMKVKHLLWTLRFRLGIISKWILKKQGAVNCHTCYRSSQPSTSSVFWYLLFITSNAWLYRIHTDTSNCTTYTYHLAFIFMPQDLHWRWGPSALSNKS